MKTRIFEAVAFSQYLLTRMFYGDLSVGLTAAMRPLGCCIGINASSKDWVWAAQRTDPGDDGFVADADYSRFDKLFLYFLHVVCYGIIYKVWLHIFGGMTEMLRYAAGRLLWAELQVQRRVDGAVVLSYAGNCSGSFWTAIINTMQNQFYLFLSWKRIHPATRAPWFFANVLAHALFLW